MNKVVAAFATTISILPALGLTTVNSVSAQETVSEDFIRQMEALNNGGRGNNTLNNTFKTSTPTRRSTSKRDQDFCLPYDRF